MKIIDFTICFILISIVFGYGHYLTDSAIVKWLCVCFWSFFVCVVYEQVRGKAFLTSHLERLSEKEGDK